MHWQASSSDLPFGKEIFQLGVLHLLLGTSNKASPWHRKKQKVEHCSHDCVVHPHCKEHWLPSELPPPVPWISFPILKTKRYADHLWLPYRERQFLAKLCGRVWPQATKGQDLPFLLLQGGAHVFHQCWKGIGITSFAYLEIIYLQKKKKPWKTK